MVSSNDVSAPSCAVPGGWLPATQPPTLTHITGTKLSHAATPKRMSPPLTSAAYMSSPSVCQKYCRADTPSQLFCLNWSGAPPCKKTLSRHPKLPEAGLSWVRKEGHSWSIITSPATGPPAWGRLVPLPLLSPGWLSDESLHQPPYWTWWLMKWFVTGSPWW